MIAPCGLTFELSRARRQALLGRGRTMCTNPCSGQAMPAVARRLERGVRPQCAIHSTLKAAVTSICLRATLSMTVAETLYSPVLSSFVKPTTALESDSRIIPLSLGFRAQSGPSPACMTLPSGICKVNLTIPSHMPRPFASHPWKSIMAAISAPRRTTLVVCNFGGVPAWLHAVRNAFSSEVRTRWTPKSPRLFRLVVSGSFLPPRSIH